MCLLTPNDADRCLIDEEIHTSHDGRDGETIGSGAKEKALGDNT